MRRQKLPDERNNRMKSSHPQAIEPLYRIKYAKRDYLELIPTGKGKRSHGVLETAIINSYFAYWGAWRKQSSKLY